MEQQGLAIDPDSVYLRLTWMFDTKTLDPAEHGDFLRTVLAKLAAGQPIACAVKDHRGLTDVNEVVANLPKVFSLPGGVYNYGSPNEKSVYTLLRDVLDALACPADLQPLEYAYRNIMIATDKIESYGIHFRTSEQALRERLRQVLPALDAAASEPDANK